MRGEVTGKDEVPVRWLREYCDPGVRAEEIAERLVMTGTEVERVGAVGPPSSDGFVVGKVTTPSSTQRRPAAGLPGRRRRRRPHDRLRRPQRRRRPGRRRRPARGADAGR